MTRGNVFLIGFIAFLIGLISYGALIGIGVNSSKAGIASEAILILLVLLWVVSYFLRVITGKMTFMEQRKRYRALFEKEEEKAIQKKFDAMSEDEQRRLIKELQNDK